ncbi:hypothetical protein F2Q69_00006187 [Brassica cretica]|uniref:Uncharacterized protein n=1 Tax=Brassica cretica TaxID=69181 RepID=A0A8S9PAY5_BRACR|nr:hypothetical protein F2Q69_00006187 [Brassica cretica]
MVEPQTERRPEGWYMLGSKTVILKSTVKIIILANSSRKTSRKKDRYEKRQVKTREPDCSHLSASPMGENDHHQGHLPHGQGRPAPRSPRPWARTTSTIVTSPMGEDDQHRGHLAYGRGRSMPGSPRPRARTIQSRLVRLVSTLLSSV